MFLALVPVLVTFFSPFGLYFCARTLLRSETSQPCRFTSSVCYYSLDFSQNHDSRIKPSFQEVDQREFEDYYYGPILMKANK